MRCSRCGKEIPNDSVFCPECGAEQTTEEKQKKMKRKYGALNVEVRFRKTVCFVRNVETV